MRPRLQLFAGGGVDDDDDDDEEEEEKADADDSTEVDTADIRLRNCER